MIGRSVLWGILGVALACLTDNRGAKAQTLVADISSHLIAISTGFTGADVVLFGATDGPGDVIVVVQGPQGPTTIRRKDRIAAIWVNNDSLSFQQVPSFYRVASSRPLTDLASPSVLKRHEIGLENLHLETTDPTPSERSDAFRHALIRGKQSQDLYGSQTLPVSFLGQRLFRTTLHFPANVPIGLYTVRVYLLRNGDVVSAQITPLSVSKIGFSADLYDYARRQSVSYAMIAILLAVGAGWLAGYLFRRDG